MMSLLNTPKNLIKTSRNAIKNCHRRWPAREHRSAPYHRLVLLSPDSGGASRRSCVLKSPVLRFGSECVSDLETQHSDYSPSISTTSIGSVVLVRHFHVSSRWLDKEPAKASSKVEETVKLLKDKANEEVKEVQVVPKKPLAMRIWEELKHYYHGFRLLFIDIKISSKLAMKAVKGETLTRREHRLLVRTTADIFRLVPFSVFIIVPFMEFLLPVFIKFFPGLLPSTFETASEKEDKMKKSLKVKLEMAKFLQKALDDMAVQAMDKDHSSKAAKEFAEFFDRVRNTGEPISNQEIMKFSKLFEDEITLDSLSRPQLIALCRVLEIQPMGTSQFLVFQLKMRLRSLAADDKMIQQEGVASLNASELQQACRARGMRAYGLPEQRLRSQLEQWLDLSLNEHVPPSLLLLSRALLLPETIPTSDQLKATISSLPDTVITQTKAVLGEREGKTDNLTKIEVLKEEQRKIQEELQERKEEMDRKAQEEKELLVEGEYLVDRAKLLESTDTKPVAPVSAEDAKKKEELTASDMETLEDALDTLGSKRKKMLVEKEELQDLKEELADYEEDVQDLQHVMKGKKGAFSESKAARRLFSRVNRMINNMDKALEAIEKKKKEEADLLSTVAEEKQEEMVRIDELISTIHQIQKVPDGARLERLSEALAKLDDDKDGSISVEDLLKMIELIGNDQNVKLSAKQLDEMALLLKREETLLLEDQIERALEKQTQQRGDQRDEEDSKPIIKESSVSNKKPPPKQNGSPPDGPQPPSSAPGITRSQQTGGPNTSQSL